VAYSEAGIETPSHPRTLVVIPTYQERENIEVVLRGVRHEAPAADVLIVDDNSPDGTPHSRNSSAQSLRRRSGCVEAR